MKKLLALAFILSCSGCSTQAGQAAPQVLTSEQTTKAIMALAEHQNDLAKKHNALLERVVKLEPAKTGPTPKAKVAK